MKKGLKAYILVIFFSLLSLVSKAYTYEEWVDRSCEYLAADSLAQAAHALKQALQLEPANPRNGLLLLNLGTLQRQLGDFSAAEVSYTAGLGFMPQHTSLLSGRASLFAEEGRYLEAADDYSTLLLQHPDNEQYLYERAICRFMAHDTLGARLDLDRLYAVNPQSAKARQGMIYIYQAQGQLREAEELCTALLERNPRSATLFFQRAEIRLTAGHIGQALDDVNQSITLAPNDPYSLYLRAKIRLMRGDKEFARRDLAQARALGLDISLIDTLQQALDNKQ